MEDQISDLEKQIEEEKKRKSIIIKQNLLKMETVTEDLQKIGDHEDTKMKIDIVSDSTSTTTNEKDENNYWLIKGIF